MRDLTRIRARIRHRAWQCAFLSRWATVSIERNCLHIDPWTMPKMPKMPDWDGGYAVPRRCLTRADPRSA